MKKAIISTLPILMLLGQVAAMRSSSRRSNIQNFAQSLLSSTQEKPDDVKCNTAIERLKTNKKVDYKTIIQTYPTYWDDSSFRPIPQSIVWPAFSDGRGAGLDQRPWKRLNQICPTCTMQGNVDDYIGDVNQGVLGDCYFLSAIAAVAENNTRLSKVFVNEPINNAGLYSFNVYVRGIPRIVTVDDYVVYDPNYRQPAFAYIGKDNSIWAALLEKAFAKTLGNFENTIGGFLSDALLFTHNLNTKSWDVALNDKNALWSFLVEGDSKGYIMFAGTAPSVNGGGDKSLCAYGINCQHAYSVLGVKTITMLNGTVAQLVQVRNPHGTDHVFTGQWTDKADIWNTKGLDGRTYGQQADLVIKDDGVLMFDIAEFKIAFSSFWHGITRDDWVTSFYDQVNDQTTAGKPAVYKFTLTEKTNLIVRALNYNPKMYGLNCRTQGQVNLQIRVAGQSSIITQTGLHNARTPQFISYIDTPLNAGTYEILYYPGFGANDTKDFTILIDSPKQIDILDSNGKTNYYPSEHDYSSRQLASFVPNENNYKKPKVDKPCYNDASYSLTGSLNDDIKKSKYSKSASSTYKEIDGGSYKTYYSYQFTNIKVNGAPMQEAVVAAGVYGEDIKSADIQVNVTASTGSTYQFSDGVDKCNIYPYTEAGVSIYSCKTTVQGGKGGEKIDATLAVIGSAIKFLGYQATPLFN